MTAEPNKSLQRTLGNVAKIRGSFTLGSRSRAQCRYRGAPLSSGVVRLATIENTT